MNSNDADDASKCLAHVYDETFTTQMHTVQYMYVFTDNFEL